MKLFITGGAGFIGSNFIRYVLGLGKGYKIVNFDKLTYAGNLENVSSVTTIPNYSFIKGDICDASAVDSAMKGCDAVCISQPNPTLTAVSTTLRRPSRPSIRDQHLLQVARAFESYPFCANLN